jgi:membrane protein YqaA with SNARE-associated domain
MMGMIRRIYDWTLGLAEKPRAAWALFRISFAESSSFPIPPDVLLIPMCLGRPRKALITASVCTVGSVTGGMFGYLVGYAFFAAVGRPILEFYNAMDTFACLVREYNQNASLIAPFLHVAV